MEITETKSPMAMAFGSVRPAVFQTTVDGADYWGTNAGCFLVTKLDGRIYCVVPRHCMNTFSPHDLVVTDDQMNSTIGVKAFFVVTWTGTTEQATGMDVEDIAVICWPESVPLHFENVVDIDNIQTPESLPGDDLAIFGLMKTRLSLDGSSGSVPYNFYDLVEIGPSVTPLRLARGRVPQGPVETTGFSGGIFWNRRLAEIAGMTLRGGTHEGDLIFHYLPFGIIRGLVVNAQAHLRAKGLIDRDWPNRVDFNFNISPRRFV